MESTNPSDSPQRKVAMRCITLLLFLISTFCSSELGAQERWFPFWRGTLTDISVDSTTIQDRGGESYEVWMKLAYKAPQSLSDGSAKTYREAKERMLLDCSGKRFKTLQMVFYESSGRVASSWDNVESSMEWSSPVPESVGDAMLSLCDRRRLLNGTYQSELKSYNDGMAAIDAVRRQQCGSAREPLLIKSCRTWYAYFDRPANKLTKKENRDWDSANRVLDSAFALKFPLWPLPPE